VPSSASRGGAAVASSDKKPKSTDAVPRDLLPIMRASGVVSERQLAEIRSKILQGDYPLDSVALAEALVRDKIVTSFQARRFLSNRPHGLVVGRYVVLDRIGSGSMGRVYKAHHAMMDRTVALKIIAPEIASNERVVARFQREMRLVGRLDHPNVVRAFDADQIHKVLYIVMEYVHGQSLGELIKKNPIPAVEMVEYAFQASLGLAHAHAQGIVHRDIKPSNILLTDDRKIKVLDLGLGVLMEADSAATFATADGIAVGTVDYMSPEQACGREVDGRSDLYGLGCSMYHLMTGKLPFPGSSPIERLGKRISGRHIPITEHLPDLPANFVKVLDRLLAHKPHERYPTAADAADALQSLLKPRTRPAPVATPPPVASPAPIMPLLDAKQASQAKPQPAPALAPAPADGPMVVKVRPNYPRWFEPAARFAERRPQAALTTAAIAATLVFAAGLVVGLLVKGWLG
jgi:eukaryotic-like serine/threonine-protein kinase